MSSFKDTLIPDALCLEPPFILHLCASLYLQLNLLNTHLKRIVPVCKNNEWGSCVIDR